jgi:hypothetical protein
MECPSIGGEVLTFGIVVQFKVIVQMCLEDSESD